MRPLWDILEGLFEKASERKFGPICNIYSAQTYGDIWRFQELAWQPAEGHADLRFDSMASTDGSVDNEWRTLTKIAL